MRDRLRVDGSRPGGLRGYRHAALLILTGLVAVAIAPAAVSAAGGAAPKKPNNPPEAAEEILSAASVDAVPVPAGDAIATRTLPACTGRNIAAFTASDFASALGLSRPVADRAARFAPDFRDVDHLLAVEGVGPTELAAIQRANPDLCTAPPVVPPVPKDACVSTRQFDLNDLDEPAERRALDKATVLSLNEVEVMNRLGPFASVRIALGVLGIGEGGYKKIMVGSPLPLCVTPPGFVTTTGTSYEWITSFLADQVAADDFALTVAPGTVTDPAGAWAYIDREDFELEYGAPPIARADVHLEDDWTGPGKSVWITVPADRSPVVPDVPLEQTVWHETGAGETEWFRGPDLLESGDALTIEATSTSWFTSVVGFAWEAFRWIRGRSVGSPSCPSPPAGSSHTGELLSNGNGGLIGECTYANTSPGQAGAIGATDRIRAEFSANYTSVSRVQVTHPGSGQDIVSSLVAQLWPGNVGSFGSDANLYLPPAGSYWDGSTYVSPPSRGQYRIDPNLAATGLGAIGDQIFGRILRPLNDFVVSKLTPLGISEDAVRRITDDAIGTLITCGYSLFHEDFPTTSGEISTVTYGFFQTCLPETFEWIIRTVADEFEEFLEHHLEAAVNTLLRTTESMDFVDDIVKDVLKNSMYGVAAQVAATLIDITRAFVVDRNVYLFVPAVRPTQLDTGQTIPASCIRGDGSTGYTVRRSCVVPPGAPGGASTYVVKLIDDPLAFVVQNGVNVGEFESGGDYICAVQSLPVRFIKDPADLERYGSSLNKLSCPAEVGGGAPRNIAAFDNVILRMSDGTTYFKNSSTMVGIEHVLDGGCFEQLADQHYGFDYVTQAEVEAALQDGWEIDDASAACGP